MSSFAKPICIHGASLNGLVAKGWDDESIDSLVVGQFMARRFRRDRKRAAVPHEKLEGNRAPLVLHSMTGVLVVARDNRRRKGVFFSSFATIPARGETHAERVLKPLQQERLKVAKQLSGIDAVLKAFASSYGGTPTRKRRKLSRSPEQKLQPPSGSDGRSSGKRNHTRCMPQG